ncbi:hypothetical protein NDU88_007995 [Pleurodeles waltl]|uniref:Uncharacterized protein n=1 Tax=Pleurodeles waltl TaxID=8319 RepID=A0AAV7PP55_PLEWA|nr:hypothetical protein NDU88_007995 [Pleurodeles waltl]
MGSTFARSNPEEETAEKEESRGTYEEDGGDAGGPDEKPETQEVEGATADRACKGDACGERKTRPKEDKEEDVFEHVKDVGLCYHINKKGEKEVGNDNTGKVGVEILQ